MTCKRTSSQWLAGSLAMAGILLCANTHAAAPDEVQWHGFLNVVGGMLKEAPRDEKGNAIRSGYLKYEDTLTFDQQTSAGLQASRRLDDRTAITMQVFAKGSVDHYAAQVRWMYLSYDVTPDDSFRIGRLGIPFYYFSDFLNVGYAYHWVTPPIDVYAFDTTLSGINYIHRDVIGDIDWSLEVMTGSEDQALPELEPGGAFVKTRNARMAILTASTGGWLTVRGMVYRMNGSFDIPALPDIDVISQDLQEKPLSYREFAVRAERDRWLGMVEWIEFDTDSYLLGNPESWYITAGYRFDNILPYVTRSRTRGDIADAAQRDYDGTLPAGANAAQQERYMVAQQLSRAAAAIAENTEEVSVGVRIDTSANTAVKIEAAYLEDHPSVPDETAGMGHNVLLRGAINATF